GALRPGIAVGDLVVTQAAVRLENASTFFVPEGYPAFAHHEAVLALVAAARKTGAAFHLGLTVTAPGFYGAQGRSLPGFPVRFPDLPEQMARIGAANFEMEASALLTLAAMRGFRAGAVCAVYANRPLDRFIDPAEMPRAEARAVDAGLFALEILARMDRERGKDGAWTPEGL
ncbi:MAG: uridine phosphorylase, partial [Planctomycetes bacterium]|nr:uridine phosphorylase [Planctomycetota bacterium]